MCHTLVGALKCLILICVERGLAHYLEKTLSSKFYSENARKIGNGETEDTNGFSS